MEIVFLAAGSNKRFKNVKNKCLIKVDGESLIIRLLRNAKKLKFKKINIVIGSNHKNLINKVNKKYGDINYIYNKKFNKRNSLYSLQCALEVINSDLVVSYSDIIYSLYCLKKISKIRNNIHLTVLKNWESVWNKRKKDIFKDVEELKYDKNSMKLLSISNPIRKKTDAMAQYMGIFFIPKKETKKLLIICKELIRKNYDITKFLNHLIVNKYVIKCIEFNGHWYEFDDLQDYRKYISNESV